MGLFSAIIGGVTGLISGGKKRKNDARNRESAERLANMNLSNAQSQREHEQKMALLSPKNNKKSFIPWVVGGAVGVLGIVATLIKKPKGRR